MEKNKSPTANLKLSKVIAGRDKWRERSNLYQSEKRKISDRNRYLEKRNQDLELRLQEKDDLLRQAKREIEEIKKTVSSPIMHPYG